MLLKLFTAEKRKAKGAKTAIPPTVKKIRIQDLLNTMQPKPTTGILMEEDTNHPTNIHWGKPMNFLKAPPGTTIPAPNTQGPADAGHTKHPSIQPPGLIQ